MEISVVADYKKASCGQLFSSKTMVIVQPVEYIALVPLLCQK